MPKIGIIYNDIKPIACKTAHQIQDQLLSRGWQVFMATGSGGLLGHSKPSRPVCFTPIDQLVPPHFDQDLSFAIVLGGDGTVHPQFAPVNGQYGTHGLFDRNLPKSA